MKTLKSFTLLTICLALFSCQSGGKEESRPWSVRMVESEISRNPEGWMLDFAKSRLIWSYCAGLELEAIIKTGEQYNRPDFFDYAYQFADTMINEKGDIRVYREDAYNIDFINPGRFVFDVWEKTGEERFKRAIFTLRDQLYTHPRTTEGGFWHKLRYPHQMWLDGLYMGEPFYARFCATFNQPEYFPDIIKQFQLAAKHTYDPATGLFRHGWDEARQQKWADPVTGQSANVWGRAMGWYAMALVDALDWIPAEQPGRDSLITILNTVAEGIEKYRDKESGLWYQVVDKGGEPGNYLEATCSSMFVYTLEKASRKGYIDSGYAAMAREAYESFVKAFVKENEDGTISVTRCCEVAGLGGDDRRDGSYEYYLSEPIRDNDPKAVGPFILVSLQFEKENLKPVKPRILISTDIGGTDPDDNQSMAHFLMYSDRFETEGLVSSPSYGSGNVSEILRMIDLYEKDLPKLRKHADGFPSPEYLRSISKQGRKGAAPYRGYTAATEGSDWIIKCARKESDQPLWVLVWGGLDDVAQALHDAPDIQDKIRIYWIGGPNKKWSANSYAYIAEHFPNLRFIEVNSSYYGFFSDEQALDSVKTSDYYDRYIRAAGHLGKDFKNYYGGQVKMGDTPSLLYLMDGDPDYPTRESWGGSFERISHSPRVVFDRVTNLTDTVAFCAIVEFSLTGPEINIPPDSICFWMETPYGNTTQKWAGYYLGNGEYRVKYAPKKAETVTYAFTSDIPGFPVQQGTFVVDNLFPGKQNATDYPLGVNWFADKAASFLYDGNIQGGKTISKWKQNVLLDWAKRWEWIMD